MEQIIQNNLNKSNHQIVVYMVRNNQTNYYYFGATTKKDDRFKSHLSALINNRHQNKNFQIAYNENPNFEWFYLYVNNPENAYILEKALIDISKDDPFCLNIRGGETYRPRLKEHNKKISVSLTGKKQSMEHVDKNRKVKIKQWKDPIYRNKQITSHTGYKYPENRLSDFKQSNQYHFKDKEVSVSVNGIIYGTIKEAAIKNNISFNGAVKRLRSKNFPNWFRL